MDGKETFSRILVAVDGSDVSMRAADAAIGMAARYGAKLYVVTALSVPYGGLYMTEEGDYEKYVRKKEREDTQKWFEEIGRRARENKVEVDAKIIDPSPSVVGSIVTFADHNNVELIVIGTRGRTGFKKLLLGSTALGVVTYAGCPVVVIK
ncbi:MAG: universal stress protein [Thaumarchaeota archaeon]|nr:universal stress protein [Nitrososphaerota archaeon]